MTEQINGRVSVGILLGSASDLELASKAASVLAELDIGYEVGIASAHRTPIDAMNYAEGAAARGLCTIIAVAGLSAALPGVVAAHTRLPVIGLPVASGALNGIDALLSVAQMPPGVPVGSVGIDGAKNAALMAARIVALTDPAVGKRLEEWTRQAAKEVQGSRTKISPLPAVPESAFRR